MAYTAADILKMSYNEMKLKVARGAITEQELRKAYTDNRKKAMNAINRIKKSDVAFTTRINPILNDAGKKTGEFTTVSTTPKFKATSKIDTVENLLKAAADVNRWLASADSTITKRREWINERLKTMHQHGFTFVNSSNFQQWSQFMEWFRATGLDTMYGSGDSVITDFFQEYEEDLTDTRPQIWLDLFNEFLDSRI